MLRIYLLAMLATWLAVGSATADPKDYLDKPAAWFLEEEARQIAANILSFQSELGGWPKNVDTSANQYEGDRRDLDPTYDNGATTDELRFLALMHAATNDIVYQTAFDLGLDYVFQGQYPNGGWPQRYPSGNDYHRHITFNDNAMVRLLEFVRQVATEEGYAFVDEARRNAAGDAFERGIACILQCQIVVNDTLTAWCAQHDEVDFRPRSARSYELATLSGSESVGIVRLLMSIDSPSPEIVQAVEASVEWFKRARLAGIRVVQEEDEEGPDGLNRVVVEDPLAPPLWARFYDIGTNQPVFADRDGVPKSALADIGYERRNGYAWYGGWPQKLLEDEYPAWETRLNAMTAVEQAADGLPEDSALLQNYPNPFNPHTTIEYRIDGFVPVELNVYDALGQKIRTLVDAPQGPGRYRLQWDGRTDGGIAVSSGVYIYRLTAGTHQETRQLVLIK
ncbi:MAG: pectate lyase [Candidatus Latescibacteria bacterium]|nr:pectate lyase [Candidatus Latescibacterota bacterium]